MTRRKVSTAIATPGGEGAALVEFIPKGKDYRIEAGAMTKHVACSIVAALDAVVKIGRDDLTALMTALSAARCGWPGSPWPMPFAVFTGGDCMFVRKHLRTLKPSEMMKAVLAASHLDAWAGERHLGLRAILARAEHFVGMYEARDLRPSKARATQVFIDVYAHAELLVVDQTEEWARVRRELSFMQPADIIDHARRMAAVVDGVRHARGEPSLAAALGLPEIAQSTAGVVPVLALRQGGRP